MLNFVLIFNVFVYYCNVFGDFSKIYDRNAIYKSISRSTMHVNNTSEEKEILTKKKSRLGIRLFFIYLVFYAGFVAIGVFQYELLAVSVFLGLNLALAYGIGLIVFAVVLGIVYNHYCSKYEDEQSAEDSKGGES